MKTLKDILNLRSLMRMLDIKSRKKHDPRIYFSKGERPSCLKCKWHYEESGSLCQGLARCNAKTYRRIK